MRKIIKHIGKHIINLLVPMTIILSANGQKLPTSQTTGVWAPATINIDGKTTEWGDKMQAYNDANRISYTVSNDDKNLYLAIHGNGLFATEKIVAGGLIFTIRSQSVKTGKEKDAGDVIITYPFIENKDDIKVIIAASEVYRKLRDDTISHKKKIDSLHIAINKLADRVFKEIKIEGVKEVADPVISVYNEQDIHAVAKFNNQIDYIYELAIPLKYLRNAISNDGKFRYNIKQPGQIIELNNGMPVPPPLVAARIVPGMGGPFDGYRFSPTDIWGEYTLVKNN